jgi:hypothetical protein
MYNLVVMIIWAVIAWPIRTYLLKNQTNLPKIVVGIESAALAFLVVLIGAFAFGAISALSSK